MQLGGYRRLVPNVGIVRVSGAGSHPSVEEP